MSVEEKSITQYWDIYYGSKTTDWGPSSFARFIASQFPHRKLVVDIGCGDGRDTLFFARRGFETIGIDASRQAIESGRRKLPAGNERCTFMLANAASDELADVVAAQNIAASETILYARFFIHAISQRMEDEFMRVASKIVSAGARLCLEFRTIEDTTLWKVEPPHYRRFIDAATFGMRCRSLNMEPEYTKTGQDLAAYGEENPFVARIVCRSVDIR